MEIVNLRGVIARGSTTARINSSRKFKRDIFEFGMFRKVTLQQTRRQRPFHRRQK